LRNFNNKINNIRDLYRGISDFRKDHQPRTNIVMDEKGDLVTDSHRILPRWRNHFSQLLNVHWVNDVRQTEIHTAELLVPQPSAFEVELAIENLRSHKLPGIDQIPAKLIKVGGRKIHFEIHKLIISTWNKEEMPEEWNKSIIVLIYKKCNTTDCSIYRCIALLPTTYKIFPSFCCQG
jgi:Mor family transcriptional regulator